MIISISSQKIQEKRIDSGDRRHEADQKLQEKKLDTEATTAQETLKQETEREKNKTVFKRVPEKYTSNSFLSKRGIESYWPFWLFNFS